MQTRLAVVLLVVALLLVGLSMSVFTVDEREQALVLQLGQPVGDVKHAGLHFKIPVIQDVRRFDSRILSVDPNPEQMVISSSRDNPLVTGAADPALERAIEEAVEGEGEESKPADGRSRPPREVISGEPIIVDTFARYRIVDPLQFLKTLRTEQAANGRLENILNESTRSVLGKTTLRELLSPERSLVMREILNRVNKKIETDNLGIEIIDVRIVRADLTPELRQSTVRRMISELRERATETRAKGEERALEIRSTAEKERTVILAEARRDSQVLRGEGDEQAIRIYTSAFNKDPDFYAFIRSLEAYRNSLGSDTQLILSPDSEFFRYFGKQEGQGR
ncbi:MAG: protease modulator HflC [Alphaproteobacteria bacterium]|nr:protease modulator HflC [Alphaproteobacteria bacterium]